jgi:hypothetical protein
MHWFPNFTVTIFRLQIFYIIFCALAPKASCVHFSIHLLKLILYFYKKLWIQQSLPHLCRYLWCYYLNIWIFLSTWCPLFIISTCLRLNSIVLYYFLLLQMVLILLFQLIHDFFIKHHIFWSQIIYTDSFINISSISLSLH